MRVKVSITLSEESLKAIDKRARQKKTHSDFIEAIMRTIDQSTCGAMLIDAALEE